MKGIILRVLIHIVYMITLICQQCWRGILEVTAGGCHWFGAKQRGSRKLFLIPVCTIFMATDFRMRNSTQEFLPLSLCISCKDLCNKGVCYV
jgi:hypothetical protein